MLSYLVEQNKSKEQQVNNGIQGSFSDSQVPIALEIAETEFRLQKLKESAA